MELKLINNSNFSLGNAGATINSAITSNCTKACIKSCPSVSQIDVLRQCANLNNVYMDNIGSVSGPISELIRYASMHGYTNEESDDTAKPYINGTFTVNGWHTTAQLQAIQNTITGLTIAEDSAYNIDTLINNDAIAVQTFDSTKANYNPAAAIILQQNNVGTVIDEPIISGGGRYFVLKSEVATITTISNWFTGVTGVTDTNAIVTSDNTQSYTFDEFDELGYFTGITQWGTTYQLGSGKTFKDCTSLKRVTIPTNLQGFQNTFNGCTALEEIRFLVPHIAGYYRYTDCSSLTKIYFNTLDDFFNSDFGGYNSNTKPGPFDASFEGHVYINNVELKSLVVPSGKTTIPRCSFMVSLETVSVPDTVTSLPAYCFNNCYSMKHLEILSENLTVTKIFGGTLGDGTGDFILKSKCTADGVNPKVQFKTMLFYKGYEWAGAYGLNCSGTDSVRIKEDIEYSYNGGQSGAFSGLPVFLECYDIVTPYRAISHNNSGNGTYLHICKNGIPTATSTNCSASKFPTILVGDGMSKASDDALKVTYSANSDWSSHSSKLATWWDYNGAYKWYYVTDNLTNCTNTNPDAWPHITRGESYQTTIEPFEGMTLDSVTVEMYEAVDDGVTPNTPTDITSSVYDSSTGEINIPSVTGNVIITASAS